jgi:hypothetical protein
MGLVAAWLGLIEGVFSGLSSFANLGSGYYIDRLQRRKPIAVIGCLVRASFGLATVAWHVLLTRSLALAGTRGAHPGAQGAAGSLGNEGNLWTRLRLWSCALSVPSDDEAGDTRA